MSPSDFQIFRLALGLALSIIGRLIICSFWYMRRSIISWLVRTRRIGNEKVRKLVSSNHYLDRDGSLLIAHNLLVSFQIEGKLNLELFRRLFIEKCIHAGGKGNLEFPELQEKIVVSHGYPFWKRDDQFKINNHILDGNELFKRKNLSNVELEQKILNEQFKGNERSPWKIYILHETDENTTRLIFCFHHSLGDGRSLYNVLMRVVEADILKTGTDTKNKMVAKKPSGLDILHPTNLIRDFIKCQPYPSFFVQNLSGDGRLLAISSRLPLDDLKEIGRTHGLPLTAVLLCAITGALRKYLSRNQQDIPDWVFCPMPIPLKSKAPGLTNAVQSVNFTLPFGAETLEERLVECKKTVQNAQKSGAFPALVKMDLWMENCYPLNRKPKTQGMPPMVLTSFPGPKSSIYFCNKDHKVTDMHFSWNGVKYISVIFTTLSYKDGIRVTVSADKNAFQNQAYAELVMELLEEEVKLLKLIES